MGKGKGKGKRRPSRRDLSRSKAERQTHTRRQLNAKVTPPAIRKRRLPPPPDARKRRPPPPSAAHQLNEPPEGTVKSQICHNTGDDCSDDPCCVCGEYKDFAEQCPYFCEIPPGKIPLPGFQVVCCYCRTPMCYLIGRYVKEFQGMEPHGKPCVMGKKCWFCKDTGHMHGLCPERVKEILPALEGDQYELPKLRPVASTDVLVTNLTPKVTEYDLFRHFGRLGANGMRTVDVDKIEGKHYGYLEFRNLEYASLAIQKANGSTTTLDGQRIKCHIVKLPHLSVNWDAFKEYTLNKKV